MRFLISIAFLIIPFLGTSQVQWNTSTRVGINRIGLGFDQSIGFDFGKSQNQSFSLGARWYSVDVVFAKETVGLVLDYRYNFRADEMPVRFSLGLNTAVYGEQSEIYENRISELTVYNRGTWNKWQRLNPFYEIGAGMVLHRSQTLGAPYQSNYFNYSLSIGVQFNFSKEEDYE